MRWARLSLSSRLVRSRLSRSLPGSGATEHPIKCIPERGASRLFVEALDHEIKGDQLVPKARAAIDHQLLPFV